MPPVRHLDLLESDHRAPPAQNSGGLPLNAPVLLPVDEDPRRRRGLGVDFRLRPRFIGAAALLPGGVRVRLALVARPWPRVLSWEKGTRSQNVSGADQLTVNKRNQFQFQIGYVC